MFLYRFQVKISRNKMKMININPLTFTELQPTFQIHTSFSSFICEWIPVGQLLTSGMGVRMGIGGSKKKRERKEEEINTKSKKNSFSSRDCCSSITWQD